ncbi:hypothetical protein ACSFBI_05230 [Variovorax sp. RB3P1]|uniref:hypothetical protein n=1 Tax=Variovorax sp. RB3P1 TaxID=3443732 RepID=UPI003F4545DC
MNNTTNRLPTTEEINQARSNPEKYMIIYNSGQPVAIYEIKRTRTLLKSPLMSTHDDKHSDVHHIQLSKHSSLRDDSWDNNNQY